MTPQEKAKETRQRHKAAWDEKLRDRREQQAAIRAALMGIVTNPDATPGQVLEAVQRLEKLGAY